MSNEETIKLFEQQNHIYQKNVCGKFRSLKWKVMCITLGVYYLAPWIRWNRGDGVPDQAILIDLANSRAYFFFIEIWPQEGFYIVGIMIFSAILLFFVTSMFGRIWCGYFCPQTVWTDLFIWVERAIQGDRNKRLLRDRSPYNFDKFWRKTVTHFLWIIISLFTGGVWVFYFNDATLLIDQIFNLNLKWSVSNWIIGLTLSTYLMAGYAREQVCIYMCPYARFQSAMFDEDTLIIGYDKGRGEPRGSHKVGDSWRGKGHCVNCTSCVQVCPMGIDIRDGLQMECIACGLCIDACDNIMDKLNLPCGLIRYDTITNQNLRAKGKKEKIKLLRPRTFYYFGIVVIIGVVMLYNLLTRSPFELHIIHDRNPLFVTLSDGKIRNGYNIKILNKTHEDNYYTLDISNVDQAILKVQSAGELVAQNHLKVLADSIGHFRIFVLAHKQSIKRQKITFILQDMKNKISVSNENFFLSGKKLNY